MEENHCKDCCCAQSWKALGITEYTGKSIPEHIKSLREREWRLTNSLKLCAAVLAGEDMSKYALTKALESARDILTAIAKAEG